MGSDAFLGRGNFDTPWYESKYESSQHFPMGGYKSIILKELHRFLQFEIYYKHRA